MNYNLDALVENESDAFLSSSECKVVFVDDYTTAADLKASILEQYPNYVSEINEKFARYRKVGPFKITNKRRIMDILCDTKEIQETLSRSGKAEAVRYVNEELEKIGLGHWGDRLPKALSQSQLLRASHLYEMFDEKKEFLLCDSICEKDSDRKKYIGSKQPYYMISEYMNCCEKFIYGSYSFIWITDLTILDMLTILGENVGEDEFSYIFFGLDGDNIVKLDKNKLVSVFAQTATGAKVAYQNAQKYDRFFRTCLPQYSGEDNLKKAFELYKRAAEIGHPGAQFGLGELYSYGHDACTKDFEKALYWYIMALYGENHIEGIAENILKEVQSLAPGRIKGLVLEVPSGKKMLRKYVGEKAEALIKEAESEALVDELSSMMEPMDQEDIDHFSGILDDFLNRQH